MHQIDWQVDNLFSGHLKRRNSWPPDVSALDALNDYTCQRHQAQKKVILSALCIKINYIYIMKY